MLLDLFGSETGSFDHKGETTEGPDGYALKYSKFSLKHLMG